MGEATRGIVDHREHHEWPGGAGVMWPTGEDENAQISVKGRRSSK